MFLIHSLVRSSSFLHCQMCLRPLLNYLGDFYRTETDFSQPKMKTKNSLLTFLYLGCSWSSDFYRRTFHTIIPTFLENAFSFWTVSSELLLGIVYRGRSERMKRTLSSEVALNFNRQRRTRKKAKSQQFRHVQFQLGTIPSAEYLFDNPLGPQTRAVPSDFSSRLSSTSEGLCGRFCWKWFSFRLFCSYSLDFAYVKQM